jgi:uncharacterized protein YyaL (SSP411 family)
MKRFVLLITAIVTLSSWGLLMGQVHDHEPGNEEGIQFFEGTWDEALALAKKEDKLIFLDVYATWCGPCKLLKSKTFPDAEAGKYFNEHFINVTLDGEKGDGLKVARQLRVTAYPSLYVLNPDGDPVVYFAGYLQPAELIELGKAGIENR